VAGNYRDRDAFRDRGERHLMPGAKGMKQEGIDPTILQLAKVAILTAQDRLVEAEAEVQARMKVRDEAIHRGRSLGMSLRDIAPLMGRTVARVSQISPGSSLDEAEGQETDIGDQAVPPS
jgi:hypothetical protein